MRYFTVILAAIAAAKHHHHVDWTAIAAVAAVFSSFAAILIAIFNPWIGYTKARLEVLTEKLEKLYQLVKEERRIASEMMFHYRSNVPTKENGQELKKPAEDFRKFKEGSAEVEVLVNLFFRGFRGSWRQCQEWRNQFVVCWYNVYNLGIESRRIGELASAQIQVVNCYDLLECDIKFKAQALGSQRTSIGIIKTAFRDLLISINRRKDRHTFLQAWNESLACITRTNSGYGCGSYLIYPPTHTQKRPFSCILFAAKLQQNCNTTLRIVTDFA
jgi:hypothetical protein